MGYKGPDLRSPLEKAERSASLVADSLDKLAELYGVLNIDGSNTDARQLAALLEIVAITAKEVHQTLAMVLEGN